MTAAETYSQPGYMGQTCRNAVRGRRRPVETCSETKILALCLQARRGDAVLLRPEKGMSVRPGCSRLSARAPYNTVIAAISPRRPPLLTTPTASVHTQPQAIYP